MVAADPGKPGDAVDLSKIKFRDVKLHAIVDPKRHWKKEKGFNYFVVDNPIMTQSLSAKGVEDGYAFARAFASRADFNPDKIFNSINSSDKFRRRMMGLKTKLREIRSQEIDMYINQRALSRHVDIFEHQRHEAFIEFLFPKGQGDGQTPDYANWIVHDRKSMHPSVQDPVLHIMGALLNPEIVQGKVVSVPGKTKEHLPYFRADIQLTKEVLNFLRKNNMEKTAKDIVDLWESARNYSTPDADNQIANIQAAYSSSGSYRFSHLDAVVANTVQDMLGYGYRDPLLNNILAQNPNKDGHYENIFTVDARGQRQMLTIKTLKEKSRKIGCNK